MKWIYFIVNMENYDFPCSLCDTVYLKVTEFTHVAMWRENKLEHE